MTPRTVAIQVLPWQTDQLNNLAQGEKKSRLDSTTTGRLLQFTIRGSLNVNLLQSCRNGHLNPARGGPLFISGMPRVCSWIQ